MAQLIPANPAEPIREVQPRNGTDFTFAELRPLLGCQTIELLDTPDGKLMVCDEESKLVDKPAFNGRATAMMGYASRRQVKAQIEEQRRRGIVVEHMYDFSGDLNQLADWICGAVVVCEQNEIR